MEIFFPHVCQDTFSNVSTESLSGKGLIVHGLKIPQTDSEATDWAAKHSKQWAESGDSMSYGHILI